MSLCHPLWWRLIVIVLVLSIVVIIINIIIIIIQQFDDVNALQSPIFIRSSLFLPHSAFRPR